MSKVTATNRQSFAMNAFYAMPETRVVFSKSERQDVWNEFKTTGSVSQLPQIRQKCPALAAEIDRAYLSDSLIQSAVFSECSYAQTLATKLRLTSFLDLRDAPSTTLPSETRLILDTHAITARYAYLNDDKSIALIQAGGHNGIDALLISHQHNEVIRLEFKEPAAKTSEPDLPQYGEDGLLRVDQAWLTKNPQFHDMVMDQANSRLNFFDVAGSNINDFAPESIERAVRENYQGEKFADLFLTEDSDGFLTLIPSTDASKWADLKGEIRPAGRNHYKVWTPGALDQVIRERGGQYSQDLVSIPLTSLATAAPRGGTGISRYKLHPFFFVKAKDARVELSQVRFNIRSIRQIRPTISAHMYFTGLNVRKVKDFYLGGQ